MRQRLFTLLCAISLVLLLAAAGMWVRSYHRSDEVRWKRAMPEGSRQRGPPPEGIWRFHAYSVRTVHGGVLIRRSEGSAFDVPGVRHYAFSLAGAARERPTPLPGASWERLGFQFSTAPDDGPRAGDVAHPQAVIPLWSICVLAGLLPGMAAIRLGARCAVRIRGLIRLRSQRCPGCAYDLRATPERCPECGTILQKARA